MRLAVLAVGRLKSGPEQVLAARYAERSVALARGLGLRGPDLVEIAEGRERDAAVRKAAEAAALLERAADHVVVAFDERGASPASPAFAQAIGTWRDSGRPGLALVIGGPDGLADSVRERAAQVVSFGRLTLPHQLVRVLVLEQLYRAMTILSGHPYHRE